MEVPAFRSERRGALCWTGVTSPLLVVVSLLVCSQVPRSRSIALHEILAILANNAGHFPGQGFHRGLLLHQEGMLAHAHTRPGRRGNGTTRDADSCAGVNAKVQARRGGFGGRAGTARREWLWAQV